MSLKNQNICQTKGFPGSPSKKLNDNYCLPRTISSNIYEHNDV